MTWEIIIPIAFILAVYLRVKIRGYFWKDKVGKKLTFKQFLKRWKEGAEGTTPLQQTKVVLWSFPFLFGGIVWGIVMTLMAGTYWMALILGASLPITGMQLLSTWQKFKVQKKIEEAMKEVTKTKWKSQKKT